MKNLKVSMSSLIYTHRSLTHVALEVSVFCRCHLAPKIHLQDSKTGLTADGNFGIDRYAETKFQK